MQVSQQFCQRTSLPVPRTGVRSWIPIWSVCIRTSRTAGLKSFISHPKEHPNGHQEDPAVPPGMIVKVRIKIRLCQIVYVLGIPWHYRKLWYRGYTLKPVPVLDELAEKKKYYSVELQWQWRQGGINHWQQGPYIDHGGLFTISALRQQLLF